MSNTQPLPSALNFRVRRPQHSWTREERYVLCCLKRFFVLQNAQITKLMNEIYAEKIQSEGFPDGLKKTTVTTQWNDLGRRFHDDWKYVHHDIPFEQGHAHFHHIFQKIRTAAASLRIALVPRARDLDVSQFGLIALPRRRDQPAPQSIQAVPAAYTQAIMTTRTEVQQQDASRPVENNLARENPSGSNQAAPAPRPREIAEITDPIEHIRSYGLNRRAFPTPTSTAQLPSLLWRFSNDDSAGINSKWGYIAYAFTVDLGSIPSPEERLEEFPAWVWSHVNKKRIPSPFISTSIDPLIPMHRALRANKNAIFSLINPRQIPSHHIFYMKDLMKQYSIFTRGYHGTKEYIVWGCISRNAILMSFRIDELMEITNQHPDIKEALQLGVISESRTCKSTLFDKLASQSFASDFKVGKTIGKLLKLLHLQKEYVDEAAAALNSSWKFTNAEDTAQFLRGANAGYDETADTQAESSFSSPFSSQSSLLSSSTKSSDVGVMHSSDLTTQEGFVLVESPPKTSNQHEEPRNDYATDESRVRESIDRLSILDNEDEDDGGVVIVSNTPCRSSSKGKEAVREKRPATSEFPIESKHRKTDGVLFPSRNRPVATRHISIFNPNSSSWSPVPESIDPEVTTTAVKKEEVVPSIEEVENHKVTTPMTPMTPRIKQSRSRSSSIDSDSTIGNDSPFVDRFGRERSHVNRVIKAHWPAGFWDSLEESARD